MKHDSLNVEHSGSSYVFCECRDERLCNRVTEHQLGANDKDLGRQALEQSDRALIAQKILDDRYARRLRLEVRVLDTRLDDVERSCDRDRRHGTRNRGNEVLCPRRLRVVLNAENVILGESGCTEELVIVIGSALRRLRREWMNIQRNYPVHCGP